MVVRWRLSPLLAVVTFSVLADFLDRSRRERAAAVTIVSPAVRRRGPPTGLRGATAPPPFLPVAIAVVSVAIVAAARATGTLAITARTVGRRWGATVVTPYGGRRILGPLSLVSNSA